MKKVRRRTCQAKVPPAASALVSEQKSVLKKGPAAHHLERSLSSIWEWKEACFVSPLGWVSEGPSVQRLFLAFGWFIPHTGMSDLTPPFPSVTSLQSEDICPLAGSPTGAGGVCEPEEDGMGEQN
uniref:Uncharacterized protein n=1 Tax=Rousettus aegyptiacus TaxID=9407 RepID=A0A7J8CHQ3_ROUAE|nr:hypothetical protein HJG63_008956 [Rousettus aegyptiacus]